MCLPGSHSLPRTPKKPRSIYNHRMKDGPENPDRRLFLKGAGSAAALAAAGPLLKAANALASPEPEGLELEDEIQRLREGLVEGDGILKWLEEDHPDKEWLTFFKRLLRVSKELEKAQKDGDS